MSVNPLADMTAMVETAPGHADRGQKHPTNSSAQTTQASKTGKSPNGEKQLPDPGCNSSRPDEDAVQVQRESGNHIVIKYLDRSGSVIFQVPTSQVIALQKAIEQVLDKEENCDNDNVTPATLKGAADGHQP